MVSYCVCLSAEHTEESKAYRKPEWVTRMEELKQAMTGIVERSRARRRAGHPCSPQEPASRPVLQSPQPVLQTSQPVLQPPQPLLQPSQPVCQPSHLVLQNPSVFQPSYTQFSSVFDSSLSVAQSVLAATPVPEQGMCVQSSPAASCVSSFPSSSLAPQPASQEPCIWVGSVISTSTYRTSISVDSLERPSASINSCMSSKDTISECDTDIGSECQSDIPSTEPQSDRLSQLELGSSLSFGDLSMGSDSVFISESETVSETPSRRHSDQTIGSSYFAEQEILAAAKSSLLSPNTKHVHFKFDGETPSTVSEDETQTESPDYAKAVMSNYLSSHRNSISQVIEALSSLAQADITAEIEMTIEQNKKQKSPEELSVENNNNNNANVSKPKTYDTDTTDNFSNESVASESLRSVEKVSSRSTGKGETQTDGITVSTKIDSLSCVPASHKPETQISVVNFQNNTVDTKGTTPITNSRFSQCSEISKLSKLEVHPQLSPIETLSSQGWEPSSVKSTDTKIQRKSILKNTGKSVLSSGVSRPENSEQVENKEIMRHQLTPTLRRKPILKKMDAMIPSSSSKPQDALSQAYCKQMTTKDTDSKVQIGNSKVNRYLVKNKLTAEKFKTECNISLSKAEKEKIASTKVAKVDAESSVGDDCDGQQQFYVTSTFRLSSSLPSTPTLSRKEHVSPPNKLPVLQSFTSLVENQRESRIPRFSKSNECTPVSTPKQVRKLSPSGGSCHKMSTESSLDSLIGVPETPKRCVWSEPSSPLTTPQLIRKTFKQIHESTKIPMPIYQYSSTEELEDSSPQESPRASKEKRQRCLVRPPRTMSVDRGMDQSHRKFSDEIVKPSRVLTKNHLPLAPKVSSSSGKPLMTELVQASNPSSDTGKNSPLTKSPTSSQSSSRYTSPRPSLVTISSPITSRKSLFNATNSLKSFENVPRVPEGVSSLPTPVMSQAPGPTPEKTQGSVPDSCGQSSEGTASSCPKISKISNISLSPIINPINGNSSQKSLFSSQYTFASNLEQQSSSLSDDRERSPKSNNNENLRKADSLEEFLLLENECMD